MSRFLSLLAILCCTCTSGVISRGGDPGESQDERQVGDASGDDGLPGDTTSGDTTSGDTTSGDTTSGDSTPGDSTPGDATPTESAPRDPRGAIERPVDLCLGFIWSQCEWLQRCRPAVFASRYASPADCASRTFENVPTWCAIDAWDTERWVGSGRATMNIAAAEALVVQADASDCSTSPDRLYWTSSVPSVFPGTIPNGGGCTHGLECQSTYCTGDRLACGECVASKSEGSVCAGWGSWSCPSELYCSIDGVCTAPALENDACGMGAPSFYCDGRLDLECEDDICLLKPQEGEACTNGGPDCRDDLGCSGNPGVCTQPVLTDNLDSCDAVHLCPYPYRCRLGACELGDLAPLGGGIDADCALRRCRPDLHCRLADFICVNASPEEVWADWGTTLCP